jgi:hypothetical protein
MAESTNYNAEISSDQKNINNVHCQFCNSLVLKSTLGIFTNSVEVCMNNDQNIFHFLLFDAFYLENLSGLISIFDIFAS